MFLSKFIPVDITSLNGSLSLCQIWNEHFEESLFMSKEPGPFGPI